MGGVTGKLLPTGNVLDVIDGVEVSCVDMAMPVMIVAAEAMGKTGKETPAELDADRDLFARMEAIRLKAGRLMGMGDVSKLVVPKPVLASRPSAPGGIASRYFTPHACHKTHAATGALAVGTAAALPGSVARRFVDPPDFAGGALRIEHPAGAIPVNLELAGPGEVRRASLVRTARRIFEGNVLVPESAFA
jgi:2-methylaconitate cis-trans-isomerase PrpF